MVLFGGREETRCRDKNDVSQIGRDIAVRTGSVFVLEGGDSVPALYGV